MQHAFADPLLGADLRQHIEALLLEANALGETSDPAVIRQRAALLVTRHFPAEQAVPAAALVERYIDYRIALGNIRPPTDPGDPRALCSALEARDRVCSGYFAPEENEALFARDAELDRYTQRQAAHGDAAARNLAQLDREERNWQTRLGDYDAARKSGASEQDLHRVRGRFFSESEQLRLPGALTARAQAAVRTK